MGTRRIGSSHRTGFTLIEVMVAMALVGLVLAKLAIVMDEARKAHEEESISLALTDQAQGLIDRIAYALYGADADNLNPFVAAPFQTSIVNYRISLGVEDGKPVFGEPEVIGLADDGGEIYWGQNMGLAGERVLVWASSVSELLEDELINGEDDNGNGLLDELGLSFAMDGKSIAIRLTLERVQTDGQVIQVTNETLVTCRN